MGATIGIFAHVDAGKTTLSEQILYKGGTIRQIGRVDNKDSFFDYDELEKNRGITIFSGEASFQIEDEKYYLIDTPGHMDFSGEMERSILPIDCAILVISAVDGIQGHTETIWRLLKNNNIPTIIFLNKVDRDVAIPDKILNDIKNKWKINTMLFNEDIKSEYISEQAIEEIAMIDEELFENYMENGYNKEIFEVKIEQYIRDGQLYPVIKGSAISGIGVQCIFEILKSYLNFEYDKDSLAAVVYKVTHGKDNERIVHLKINSGIIKPKDEIDYINKDGEKETFKVNEIREYSGSKYKSILSASGGNLCGITGATSLKPGNYIGHNIKDDRSVEVIPVMSASVKPEKDVSTQTVLQFLGVMEDEEPSLVVEYIEETKEINIRYMGEIQLEILKCNFKKRFNIEIEFGDRSVIYKETITNSVLGSGHFEPLKHYAEVHLLLSPNERGRGITFESKVHVDDLSINWQRLIESHIYERKHKGVLIGSELTDIHINLIAGRAHLKHTEGGDFREATYRALHQGLMKIESIILEPWYKYEIEIDIDKAGRVFSDIEKRGGKIDKCENYEDCSIIKGICPVKGMQNYQTEFLSFSKGRGKIITSFDGYYPAIDQDKIVGTFKYNPEGSQDSTPHSIFCSHGAGYLVKWQEADQHMHIKVNKDIVLKS